MGPLPTEITVANAKSRKGIVARTKNPIPHDFIWAAGFFEGDGYCGRVNTEQVIFTQKDLWPLEKLRSLFGGNIVQTSRDAGKRKYYQWNLNGARARGFLQSIYELLSPRRQEQARQALNIVLEKV